MIECMICMCWPARAWMKNSSDQRKLVPVSLRTAMATGMAKSVMRQTATAMPMATPRTARMACNGHSNGQQGRVEVARATQSQIRAIFAISKRQGLDPTVPDQ